MKNILVIAISVVLSCVLAQIDPVFANGGTSDKISELEDRVSELEERLEEEKVLPFIEGLNIGAGITLVTQATIDANNANQEDVMDATYSVDLEIEKEFEEYGLAFIHLEAGGGAGLDGDEMDLFSVVNKDAADSSSSVAVVEAWYEHYFFDKAATLTFGKIDATCYLDDNTIANDECSQFLGGAFKNSTVLEFPDDNSIGIRLCLEPIELIEVNLGFIDDNADWEDVFKNSFVFGQVNVKPSLLDLEGNYRLYFWRDDSEHTELLDATRDEKVNWGWGLSLDQQLVEPVTVFFRYGWADERVSNIEYAWSIGLQISGELWDRDDDVLGVAFGQNIPGGDYGKAGNSDHHEGHLEAYYNFHLNDNLSISPDVQIIWNPKGVASSDEGRDDTAFVLGLRAQIDL